MIWYLLPGSFVSMPPPVVGIFIDSSSGAHPVKLPIVMPVAVFKFEIMYPLVLISPFTPVAVTIKLHLFGPE